MKLKKAALQTLSVVTAVGLSLGVAAPAGADEDEPQFGAKDLLSDNTHITLQAAVSTSTLTIPVLRKSATPRT